VTSSDAPSGKARSAGTPPPIASPREKKEREPDPEPAGAPEWIVTFTDMISLLVTFFVLLMTFSTMEEYDMVRIKGVLKLGTGVIESVGDPRLVEPPENDLISKTDPLIGAQEPHPRPPTYDSERTDDEFRAQRDNEKLRDLNDIADGLLIQWGADAAFEEGSIQPNATLRKALRDVAETLAPYPHLIVVEGHTAPGHVPTRAHPDAESIALARARECVRILVEEGGIARERIQVAGYGDTRAKALNDTPAGRAQNRRVELRVLSMPRDRAAFLGRGSGDAVR
jgi:chemotaxis protein MotB